jgi:spore coat protein U-like protein
MRTITKVVVGLAAVAMLATVTAQAQSQTGSVSALANVQQPINVVGAVDLDFGNVFPGVAKTVGVAAATAGRFDVSGQASAPVLISFVLPANLASGGDNLPIGTWTGHHNTVNAPAGGTNFTPSAATTNSAFSAGGSLWVFVGATVSPAANQPAGAYSGTVQMTVTY